MRFRLKMAWKNWPVGHEFTDMPANVAAALAARGVGEAVAAAVRAPVRQVLTAGRNYVSKAKT